MFFVFGLLFLFFILCLLRGIIKIGLLALLMFIFLALFGLRLVLGIAFFGFGLLMVPVAFIFFLIFAIWFGISIHRWRYQHDEYYRNKKNGWQTYDAKQNGDTWEW